MTEDRGGLRYRIVTEGDFAALDAFFKKLETVDAKFASLKANLAKGIRATGTSGGNKDLENREKAAKKTVSALDILIKREQKARVEREISDLAAQRNSDLTRRTAAQIEAEKEARDRITEALRRQKVQQEVLNQLKARGLDSDAKLRRSLGLEAQQLTVAAEAQNRLAAAIRKRAVQEELLRTIQAQGKDTPELRRLLGIPVAELSAEATAREQIARALRAQAIAQARLALEQRVGIKSSEATRRAAGTEATAQVIAQNRIDDALRKLAVRKAILARLASGEIRDSIALRRALGLETRAREQNNAAAKLGAGARLPFQGVAGTLTRIGAAILFFGTIDRAARGLTNIVQLGIGFNAELEVAQNSIAGIVSQTLRLRDAQGQILTGAQAFAAAQGIAADQAALLRKDALRTVATFEELLSAFQVSFAFGAEAGFSVDQIREFTVDISQAASLLGVAQNQLAEEIRSLLQGTITPRNTRIATALGITNEDIRNAREAGTLFEFLQGELGQLSIAAERNAGTFRGLGLRIKDAATQASAAAGQGAFGSLKGLLQDVFGLLTTPQGDISPFSIEVIQPVFDAIQTIVEDIRKELNGLDLNEVVAQARSFGNALEGALSLILNIGVGVAGVAATITRVLNQLRGTAEILANLIGADADSLIRFLTTTVLTLGLLAGTVTILFRPLAFLIRVLKASTAGAGAFAKAFEVSARNAKILAPAIASVGKALGALALALPIIEGLRAALRVNDETSTGVLVDTTLLDDFKLFPARLTAVISEFETRLTRAVAEAFDSDALRKEAEEGVLRTAEAVNAVDDLLRRLTGQPTFDKETGRIDALTRSLEGANGPAKIFVSTITDQIERLAEFSEQLAKSSAEFDAFSTLIGRGFQPDEAEDFQEVFAEIQRAERRIAQLQSQLTAATRRSAETGIGAFFEATLGLPIEQTIALAQAIQGTGQSLQAVFPDIDQLGQAAIDDLQEIIFLRAEINDLGTAGAQALADAQRLADQKRQIKFLKEERDLRRSLLEQQGELVALRAQSIALTRPAADLAQAQAALQTERLASKFRQDDLRLQLQLTSAAFLRETAAGRLTSILVENLGVLQQELDLEQQITAERQRQLAAALARADLVANGSFDANFSDQLFERAEQSETLNEAFRALADTAFEASANALSGTFKSIFAEDSSEALEQVAIDFGLALGDQALQQLSTSLISGLISLFGSSAATNALTLQTSATVAAKSLTTGGILAGNAMILAAQTAALIISGAKVAGSVTIPAGSPAQGGVIGFAGGGRVPSSAKRIPHALPGFDPRDRIHALLRPLEGVLPPESMQKYGLRSFEAMRRGLIDPASLAAITPPVRTVLSPASSTVPLGMASGGAVPGVGFRGRLPAAPRPGLTQAFIRSEDLVRALSGRDNILQQLQNRSGAARPPLAQ